MLILFQNNYWLVSGNNALDDTFEEEVEETCEDVPGLIRVIASPCKAWATVAFQHYLVRF